MRAAFLERGKLGAEFALLSRRNARRGNPSIRYESVGVGLAKQVFRLVNLVGGVDGNEHCAYLTVAQKVMNHSGIFVAHTAHGRPALRHSYESSCGRCRRRRGIPNKSLYSRASCTWNAYWSGNMPRLCRASGRMCSPMRIIFFPDISSRLALVFVYLLSARTVSLKAAHIGYNGEHYVAVAKSLSTRLKFERHEFLIVYAAQCVKHAV
jgi:hypothetical protein